MWQKETADIDGDAEITANDRAPTWCDALLYCETLVFAGHNDWRLPNIRELQSIVDYGRFNPSIDPIFDVVYDGDLSGVGGAYWSSTSYTSDPDDARSVSFDFGYVFIIDGSKGVGNHVRAVRSAR